MELQGRNQKKNYGRDNVHGYNTFPRFFTLPLKKTTTKTKNMTVCLKAVTALN